MDNKTKIIYMCLAFIIIIGIILTATVGLNNSVKYSNATQIQFQLEQDFEINDIKCVLKEVIGNKKAIVQKVEVYEQIVSITVKEISDEQIEALNQRINEKYNVNNSVEGNVLVSDIARMRYSDMVIPYILPLTISIIGILIYAGIRFRDINIYEIIIKILGYNILAQVLYLSVLAITRIPVDTMTIPTAISIYVIVTLVVFNSFEKYDENKVETTKKESKSKDNKKAKAK